ncbi:helix-turn-helix domain-containing protein [Bifidobacterium breve]|jgi:transcriptional regulator with XRE-family HTH domain|uniref:helix-turn-helix domain-containing protein n=1 Tax=Bifidobacterium breve TaxID=1685 RepID=UPI00254C4874|nr:helix-turn-helix transcriptional regulator [Bifidobacterium breve]MDK8732178.1 helix-turn-helix transcriptional regulator [Bifidobacterium breve]
MNQIKIRRLRQLAGKTKSEIAGLFGMSVNTYSKYEDDPMSLPYATYHQLVEYLETAIQVHIKLEKEKPMNAPIKAKVRFVDPRDAAEEDRLEDYTVPIPEGLTEEFHPSQPVTPKQIVDWETKNKEPYPGYAEEENKWERAWEEVNRAQLKADGGYLHIADPVHVDPEFDEATGEPIIYDETHIVVDPKTGETTVYSDEADMSAEEIADSEPVKGDN